MSELLYNACEEHNGERLIPGDLVFFHAGWLAKLITSISAIISSYPFHDIYHVAMVTSVNQQITIIDASVNGVNIRNSSLYNIPFFFYIEVRHVNVSTEIRNKAVEIAEQYAGYPYNDLFFPNFVNSKGEKSFYCSQLIQHAYNEAAGKEIFPSHSMGFQGEDGEISPKWVQYYADRGISEVPHGLNGTHPGRLYDSDLLISFNNV